MYDATIRVSKKRKESSFSLQNIHNLNAAERVCTMRKNELDSSLASPTHICTYVWREELGSSKVVTEKRETGNGRRETGVKHKKAMLMKHDHFNHLFCCILHNIKT